MHPGMTDWFRVLADLRKCGYSLRAVARETGVRRGRISHVWAGTTGDFRHRDGVLVLQLWSRCTHRSIDDAPRLA